MLAHRSSVSKSKTWRRKLPNTRPQRCLPVADPEQVYQVLQPKLCLSMPNNSFIKVAKPYSGSPLKSAPKNSNRSPEGYINRVLQPNFHIRVNKTLTSLIQWLLNPSSALKGPPEGNRNSEQSIGFCNLILCRWGVIASTLMLPKATGKRQRTKEPQSSWQCHLAWKNSTALIASPDFSKTKEFETSDEALLTFFFPFFFFFFFQNGNLSTASNGYSFFFPLKFIKFKLVTESQLKYRSWITELNLHWNCDYVEIIFAMVTKGDNFDTEVIIMFG